jgi:hypothetical protein
MQYLMKMLTQLRWYEGDIAEQLATTKYVFLNSPLITVIIDRCVCVYMSVPLSR